MFRLQHGTRAQAPQSSSYKGIDKLNSANYSEWQNYAQAKLVKEKLWTVVENFPENPTNNQIAQNNLAKAELILIINFSTNQWFVVHIVVRLLRCGPPLTNWDSCVVRSEISYWSSHSESLFFNDGKVHGANRRRKRVQGIEKSYVCGICKSEFEIFNTLFHCLERSYWAGGILSWKVLQSRHNNGKLSGGE